MLTVLATTDYLTPIRNTIASVDRLGELVTLVKHADTVEHTDTLFVAENCIKISLDWHNTSPPYLLPAIPFTEKNMLALVFFKLGNEQRAFEYLEKESSLYRHLLTATHLKFGHAIGKEMIAFVRATSPHNLAIIYHYGTIENPLHFEAVKALYTEALNRADCGETNGFTAQHYFNLLFDRGDLDEAQRLIEKHRELVVSDDAVQAMNAHLATVLMARLTIPYDADALERIHALQLNHIDYLEAKVLPVQAGLVLLDAADIANYKKEHVLSQELIGKAIRYFKKENITELLGEAVFKKAILLYAWSKNGSPQYYKAAINAFQDALKIFKKDRYPQRFADIHHNLALIYSEIPLDTSEKAIWAAFCASSFKEALAFYTKSDYPYEYAMVSHNYATALMGFPPAKFHDNLERSAILFDEALQVRTASAYPVERSLTLLNRLELEWMRHHEGNETKKQYLAMKKWAEEVKSLLNDNTLLARADDHLDRLQQLKILT